MAGGEERGNGNGNGNGAPATPGAKHMASPVRDASMLSPVRRGAGNPDFDDLLCDANGAEFIDIEQYTSPAKPNVKSAAQHSMMKYVLTGLEEF